MRWATTPVETSVTQTEAWIQTRIFAFPDTVWNFVIELLPTEDADTSGVAPVGTSKNWSTEGLPMDLDNKTLETMRGQEGIVIGLVGAVGGPELGYGLHPSFHGRGYCTEAVKGFLEMFWEVIPEAPRGLQDSELEGQAPAPGPDETPDPRHVAAAVKPSTNILEHRARAAKLSLGIKYMEAMTDAGNVASHNVVKKLGFSLWSSSLDNFESPTQGLRSTMIFRLPRPGTQLEGTPGPFELDA